MKTVVHLPPLPGETFELAMRLDDLTARLDEVDRRVQCREMHQCGLEPNLPRLVAVFRRYCGGGGAGLSSPPPPGSTGLAAEAFPINNADFDPDADPPMEISREEDEEELHRGTVDTDIADDDDDDDDDEEEEEAQEEADSEAEASSDAATSVNPFLLSGAGLMLMLQESGLVKLGVHRDMAAWVLRQMGLPPELAAVDQTLGQSPQGLTLDEWLEFLVRCGFYLAAEDIRRERTKSGARTSSAASKAAAKDVAAASAAAAMASPEAEVLTPGGERRLLLVAARALDPVLDNAEAAPPPPEGFAAVREGRWGDGEMGKGRVVGK